MKKVVPLILSVSLVLVSFYGCNKEDDDDAPTPAKTDEQKIVGTWKLTAYTVDPPIDFFGITISDIYNSGLMDDCDKDNLFVFNSGKTYEVNEGATKCFTSDPQVIESGTWTIDSKNKVLNLTSDSGYVEMIEYTSLSTSKFVVEFVEADSSTTPPTEYTYTQTLTKQ